MGVTENPEPVAEPADAVAVPANANLEGDADAERRVLRLVGIYHAEGTLWGELSYVVRSRLGGAHCSLCDITHGSWRVKPEWKVCRAELPVEFDTVHLDERDPALAVFTDGQTPCVVAETTTGFVLLLGPDDLDECAGSPETLVDAVRAASAAADLDLTRSDPRPS